jgi:predicted ABC-type ATPase
LIERNLYIIAGCNGAGKTTASFTILPEIINCREFVNADEIAKGLSPFQPEHVALKAGRIMLNRINDLLLQHESFAFETTLDLFEIYMPIVDGALIFDNSFGRPELLAEKINDSGITVFNPIKFELLNNV